MLSIMSFIYCNMIIDKNDFKGIYKKVRQHYEYGADTVMCRPQCDKNDLHFCIGDDEQLFYHEQSDAYGYEAISVRALYEIMALIDKGKVPAREWVPEKEPLFYKSPFHHHWIDVGSMMEERELVNSLHWRMKKADWHYDYSDDHSEWRRGLQEIEQIKMDLLLLSKWDTGRQTAGKLWDLYVPAYTIPKPDFLTLKLPNMDEKALSFNENQLKRTGFAEAWTPTLKAQMEQGLPEIKHPFKKEYDGDRVEATLHLKKSTTSDFYFLNKFDLQLQKEGQANAIKQTFYLTQRNKGGEEENGSKQRLENKYTLKEGYNLLAGRPVFKDLVNQEGHAYQAWVKLNFKNTQNNGNYEMKQYHTNYGFDLEKTLNHYPIKELANPQYKQSLVDSLQRGNLQKATFVGPDGKEEKLLISPNITFGSLNVFDQNKQRMPTETLVEKQYIGKELAEKLTERVNQQQQQRIQAPPQQKPEQTPKQEVKKNQSLKQEKETPVKKQTRKHKIQ
jgi:hypothetical protein